MAHLYKISQPAFLFIISILLSSCNDDLVTTEAKYEPKIVIAGLLQPGRRVENIQITRNYHLNESVNVEDLFLEDAGVYITDLGTNISYELTNSTDGYAYYGNDLRIGYGKSYRIDVSAVIDGQQLKASSVTTTPKSGFGLNIPFRSLRYREKDNNGNLKQFQIKFRSVEGAYFYLFSFRSQNPASSIYIYENPYYDIDSSFISENLEDFSHRYMWVSNLQSNNVYTIDVSWLNFWFYGGYDVMAYAGDLNYYHFVSTYNNIQEVDGNFHEPKFNIDGDGIGFFGSVISIYTIIEVVR